MADKKEKSLEMRIAELEDKQQQLEISEEELKTYRKVAAVLHAQGAQGCVVHQCTTVASTVVRQCTMYAQIGCVVHQCTMAQGGCVVHQCTTAPQAQGGCVVHQCTTAPQAQGGCVVHQCTTVPQAQGGCVVHQCTQTPPVGGGGAAPGYGPGGAGDFGNLGGN